MVTDIETLPDATAVIHQAVSVLLGEELPNAVQNPDILAGFIMLTERVIESINQVREDELVLLRNLAVAVAKWKLSPTTEVTQALRAYQAWQATE